METAIMLIGMGFVGVGSWLTKDRSTRLIAIGLCLGIVALHTRLLE